MGAWSIDALGNDDAADWVYGLQDSKGLTLLTDTLNAVLAVDGYLGAPEGSMGVAAAEAVARLLENPATGRDEPDKLDEWVASTMLKPDFRLIAAAKAVVDRVVTEPSELLELWAETELFAAWKQSLVDLKDRLP